MAISLPPGATYSEQLSDALTRLKDCIIQHKSDKENTVVEYIPTICAKELAGTKREIQAANFYNGKLYNHRAFLFTKLVVPNTPIDWSAAFYKPSTLLAIVPVVFHNITAHFINIWNAHTYKYHEETSQHLDAVLLHNNNNNNFDEWYALMRQLSANQKEEKIYVHLT